MVRMWHKWAYPGQHFGPFALEGTLSLNIARIFQPEKMLD